MTDEPGSVLDCPNCDSRMRVVSKGTFKCPNCGKYWDRDEDAGEWVEATHRYTEGF
jgi:tRNA(Ile2) C34 agmatinyltransferase TiaS